MYTLKLSEPFINDVDKSVCYIKHTLQAPVAAKNLKEEVKKAYKKIKETPFIYPAVPDKYLASLGYRFIMVNNYMMFYVVEDKIIYISRFLYGHRDWMNILGKPEFN
jgi:plasmid stabilization system protein ParE